MTYQDHRRVGEPADPHLLCWSCISGELYISRACTVHRVTSVGGGAKKIMPLWKKWEVKKRMQSNFQPCWWIGPRRILIVGANMQQDRHQVLQVTFSHFEKIIYIYSIFPTGCKMWCEQGLRQSQKVRLVGARNFQYVKVWGQNNALQELFSQDRPCA